MRIPLNFLCVLLLPIVPALADDGVAGLANGGLVLEKTDKVELRSEDLYLSPKEVRISYRFFNKTSQDLPVTIAFPMPDITGSQEIDVDIPNLNDVNFLNFKTKVDGKPIESTVEQRAFLVAEGKPEVEITRDLQALGIPMMPTVDATAKAFAKLPVAKREDLIARGLLEQNSYDEGKVHKTDFVPLWTLRAKFVRPQVFPAGKEILVEQRYEPSLDATSGVYVTKDGSSDETFDENRKTFCMDDDFLKSAALVEAQNKTMKSTEQLAFQKSLAYVITSGANWAGPIGDFRLVVDKGFVDNLVSFCGSGVRKISPTQFEMKVKNYMPTQDLHILFISKHG